MDISHSREISMLVLASTCRSLQRHPEMLRAPVRMWKDPREFAFVLWPIAYGVDAVLLVWMAGVDVVPLGHVAGIHGDLPHDPLSPLLFRLDLGVRVLGTASAF